jgi:hypothetical protein
MSKATKDDIDQGNTRRFIYEGHLTKLFAELGLAVPYYTEVMQDLKKMRCVEQISRGGGKALSKWQLIQSPTEELYSDSKARPIQSGASPTHLTNQQLQQQIRDLNRQIQDLSNRVRTLEVQRA